MTPKEIVKQIKSLSLPEGEYIAFGSTPLVMHGIRGSHDIDILVSPRVFADLRSSGWAEKNLDDGSVMLSKGPFDVGRDWNYGSYNPTLEELLERAEIIDGIPFASLDDLVAWKTAFGREKDLADIALVKAYFVSKV